MEEEEVDKAEAAIVEGERRRVGMETTTLTALPGLLTSNSEEEVAVVIRGEKMGRVESGQSDDERAS